VFWVFVTFCVDEGLDETGVFVVWVVLGPDVLVVFTGGVVLCAGGDT
jgi:hypothetical protein